MDSLLTSSAFNFEQHPQHDLQWTLLLLLIELSNETSKSVITDTTFADDSCDISTATGTNDDEDDDRAGDSKEDNRTDEINWEEYLREGQQEFFCDYRDRSQDSVRIFFIFIYYNEPDFYFNATIF